MFLLRDETRFDDSNGIVLCPFPLQLTTYREKKFHVPILLERLCDILVYKLKVVVYKSSYTSIF